MIKQTNMLKLINLLLMLVILCGGGIQSINGEALQCQFKDYSFFDTLGYEYSCSVIALENPNDDKIITGYSGNHQQNKYDKDVQQILVSFKDTYFIPEGLGSVFNITALAIRKSKLVEIRSKDFYGMQNLEYLSLSKNKLTSIPSDAFSSLTKLKFIVLYKNQIKYIGSGAFDQLTNLDQVHLQNNFCVNKWYIEATKITQMKEDLKVNCVEPLSTSTTTTTTTTMTQNPMEVELEALKNEAKEQQQKNEIDLNKLRDDLKKEQMENIKIRKDKDALKKDKNNLMKDRESLKIELKNKFTEINELKEKFERNCEQPIETIGAVDVKLNEIMNHLMKESKDHQKECNELIKLKAELSLTKDLLKAAKDQQKKDLSEEEETMKETIIDLNTEVIEVKSQRQLERTTYRQLRSKLMETKEQLATCEINERSLI